MYLNQSSQFLANWWDGLSLGFANLRLQALQRFAGLCNGLAACANSLQRQSTMK